MAASVRSRFWWYATVFISSCILFIVHSSVISRKTNHIGKENNLPLSSIYLADGIACEEGITCLGEAISSSISESTETPPNFNGASNKDIYEDSQFVKEKPNKTSTYSESSYAKPANTDPECRIGPLVTTLGDRPLILYAYFESDFARQNLQFFIDHGLHSAADFIFILNGETDAAETVIFREHDNPRIRRDRSNILVKKRENKCYDLGAHAEILNSIVGGDGWSNEYGPVPASGQQELELHEKRDESLLKDKYKRFILMNASIRGPFLPLWSNSCWSDAYLNRINDKVKMVGMTYNCHGTQGHVQSMIWALDRVGLEVILEPTGIGECFPDWYAAVHGEVRTTKILRDHGYEVDVMLSVYHSKDKESKQGDLPKRESSTTPETSATLDVGTADTYPDLDLDRDTVTVVERRLANDDVPGDFWKTCTDEDYLGVGSYFGTFVHPYETLFMKSHRNIENNVLELLTKWHNGRGDSSYDVCF